MHPGVFRQGNVSRFPSRASLLQQQQVFMALPQQQWRMEQAPLCPACAGKGMARLNTPRKTSMMREIILL
jgi:hypothetical protein